jgi:hypothetical protein
MSVIRRTATLPDSSNKADFYTIIDSSTVDTIVNADIDADAAIADTKLAQLSTANKVSAAALCSLSSLPSSAGFWPVANLASIPNASLLPISLTSWIDGGSLKNLASVPSGAGSIPVANQGYTSWVDYSSTSTVVGWEAGVTKKIYYKILGNIAFVIFDFDGTSNSATTTFTLPFTAGYYLDTLPSGYVLDAGSALTSPGGIIFTSTTVSLYKTVSQAAFTATGLKRIKGQFFTAI